jgi:hypothetical protein
LSEPAGPTAGPFDLPGFWKHLTAIPHPGAAPDVTATAAPPEPSSIARRALRRRVWLAPVPLLAALVPAALAFGVELPMLYRFVFLGAAVVVFLLVRWALRRRGDVAAFRLREQEARKRWQSALAEWEAQAGPRRFEDKRAEFDKLRDWWIQAAGQPEHRARIEAAIRRGFGELQQIADHIQFQRTSLRATVEEAYRRLLQAQLDLEAVSKKR